MNNEYKKLLLLNLIYVKFLPIPNIYYYYYLIFTRTHNKFCVFVKKKKIFPRSVIDILDKYELNYRNPKNKTS